MNEINETHDQHLMSWVESANAPSNDFPIQNLPFCMFSRRGQLPRAGVAIGEEILDLSSVADLRLLDAKVVAAVDACNGKTLIPLLGLAEEVQNALRSRLSNLLRTENNEAFAHRDTVLVSMDSAILHMPVDIGSFTDFFTSIYHTERGGRVTRPDNPVPENFKYMPIAYNSRASSICLSGKDIRRPNGQRRRIDGEVEFGPVEALDFELELGAFINKETSLGRGVSIDQAAQHIAGYCLLNDWSARDVQRWESFPLGPFLSKSFSTTISPFVVTSQALAPFRAPAAQRVSSDPKPLTYLLCENDQKAGGIDLTMEAYIETAGMHERGEPPFLVCRTNFKDMYWTFSQMVTHHTSNGCNLRLGDLLGSGTASGPTDDSRACLSEITAGKNAINIGMDDERTWLEDGDTVIFRARAQRAGFREIGFGECRGRIITNEV